MSDNTPQFSLLKSTANTWDAHMCCEFLRSRDVDAHLLNDQHNSMEPYLAQMIPVRVMVPTDELERAQLLLDQLETAPTEPTEELDGDESDGDDI
jgi:hypothetical protein